MARWQDEEGQEVMAGKSKSRVFGCKVPAGSNKRGCGGGAKVVDLEKALKKIDKRVAKVEKHVAKKSTKNVADGVNRRRPGGTVDR